jgi:hypothetical protein
LQNAHPIYSLQGTTFVPLNQAFEVIRSRSQAAVEAVALTMQRLGFAALIASQPCRQRDIVLAMVAARIVAPHDVEKVAHRAALIQATGVFQ